MMKYLTGNLLIVFLLQSFDPSMVHALEIPDDLNFALNLYQNTLKSTSSQQNIGLSPFSTGATLFMIFLGSRGQTQSQIDNAMGFSKNGSLSHLTRRYKAISQDSTSYTLDSANAIFLDREFQIFPEFRRSVTQGLGGEIFPVDFSQPLAVRDVNNFVARRTRNMIHDLLPSVKPDTQLLMVNALYFKADWLHQFKTAQTSRQPFTMDNGRQKNVKMMNMQKKFLYGDDYTLDAQLLELPYKDNVVSLLLIVPRKPDGMRNLEQKITAENLGRAIERMSMEKVNINLPRFKIKTNTDLGGVLQRMGISTAFTDKADLSGISQQSLKIGDAMQEVVVEMDEKGTVAAAATGVRPVRHLHNSPHEFWADRPFLFLIIHKQEKSVLFICRVSDI